MKENILQLTHIYLLHSVYLMLLSFQQKNLKLYREMSDLTCSCLQDLKHLEYPECSRTVSCL